MRPCTYSGLSKQSKHDVFVYPLVSCWRNQIWYENFNPGVRYSSSFDSCEQMTSECFATLQCWKDCGIPHHDLAHWRRWLRGSSLLIVKLTPNHASTSYALHSPRPLEEKVSVFWTFSKSLKQQNAQTHRCPIVATVGYLCFCYFGKKFMMSRSSGVDEVVMKQAMRVYNLYQTLFNILCIVLCLRAHRDQKMLFWGNVTDFGVGGFGMSQFIWLHYNNKYVELLDTFFMVCRRKFEQLSFLHIYHHTLLIWSWYVLQAYLIWWPLNSKIEVIGSPSLFPWCCVTLFFPFKWDIVIDSLTTPYNILRMYKHAKVVNMFAWHKQSCVDGMVTTKSDVWYSSSSIIHLWKWHTGFSIHSRKLYFKMNFIVPYILRTHKWHVITNGDRPWTPAC